MRRRPLVPNILFVEINSVAREHCAKLLLERSSPMVFFLIANIVLRLLPVFRTDGEHSITALPTKLAITRPKRLDEFGRLAFHLLDKPCASVLPMSNRI